MLSRESIKAAAQSPKMTTVDLPAWGGQVNVRVMSGTERNSWEQSITDANQKTVANFREQLLVRTVCDDQGNRIYTDSDVDELSACSAPELSTLYDAAAELNLIGRKARDAAAGNS